MEIVHVMAVITAKPGMREKLLEAFQRNSPKVREEHGCIEYIATIDAEQVGPLQTKFGVDTFVVVEKWESLDALKDHVVSSHMAAYARKTKDLIESRAVYVLSAAAVVV